MADWQIAAIADSKICANFAICNRQSVSGSAHVARPRDAPRRVPHPLHLHLHDLQLARRDAARGGRVVARVRGYLGHPRRARVGRAVVDDGEGSGRRDCAAHRRAGGDDWHVRERHRRAHVGVVDTAPTRHPGCHRVFGRRLSVDGLSVPRTGGVGLPPRGRSCQRRRLRGSGAHCRRHRRPHGPGRRIARAVPLVVHPRPGAHRGESTARRRAR